MVVQNPQYHCPECGYDLRGQTVDRCPECGFHYDLPALRDLGWRAFYARYDPYLTAAKILAPAGVLSFGLLTCPPKSLLLLLVGAACLPSWRVIESWILGSLGRDLRDLDWLSRQTSLAMIGLGISVFTAGHSWTGPLWFGAVTAVVVGVAFVAAGYLTGPQERAYAVTTVRQGLLDRAAQAALALAVLDVIVLLTALIVGS